MLQLNLCKKRGQTMSEIKFSQEELNIVKQLTGITDARRINVNNIGWTSRAYVIDEGKIVFKFPRTTEDKQGFLYEINALELIKQHEFAVKTPIINWSTVNNEYIGFFGVDGHSLNQERISEFTVETKKKIGTEIGLFLKQLHALDAPTCVYVMSVEDEIAEYQAKYQMALPTLASYFDSKEIQVIDELFMKIMPTEMLKHGEELVFSHGDLTFNNMMLTDKNELGIIDFGDAGLYEQSKDFIALKDEAMLNGALSAYGDTPILRLKIEIRQKLLPVLDILYYVGKNDLTGVMKCINLIKDELIESIHI